MNPIVAENIVQSYPTKKTVVEALKGITFSVEKGEIFGIIGPDGAGKTSLFRILTTLLAAKSGKAWVDGFDVVTEYEEIRKHVGYMPGKFSLYQDLSVQENLEFFAAIFNTSIEENYDLVKDIYQQLEPFKTRRAGALSGGMKQKLALCCAPETSGHHYFGIHPLYGRSQFMRQGGTVAKGRYTVYQHTKRHHQPIW